MEGRSLWWKDRGAQGVVGTQLGGGQGRTVGSLGRQALESELCSNSVRGGPRKFPGHTVTVERPVSN